MEKLVQPYEKRDLLNFGDVSHTKVFAVLPAVCARLTQYRSKVWRTYLLWLQGMYSVSVTL